MAGKAGRSGRKSKAEEMGLTALLDKVVKPAEREALLKRLLVLSKDSDGRLSLEAAKLLMAYLYGTPRSQVEVSGPGGEPLAAATVIVLPDNGRDTNRAAGGTADRVPKHAG